MSGNAPELPNDLELERGLAGAMILLPDRIPEVLQITRAEDLYHKLPRVVCATVVQMQARGEPVDVITVRGELVKAGFPLEVGLELRDLTAEVPIAQNILAYARGVDELAGRRRLLKAAHDLAEAAASGADTAAAVAAINGVGLVAGANALGPHLMGGGLFLADAPEGEHALWGDGPRILWAKEQPLIVAGPTGVGHTTLLQRLLLEQIGLGTSILLGYPVEQVDGRIIYVAADRPRQAQRSLARMVSQEDQAILDERLLVHWGPLDFDIAAEPKRLSQWARNLGGNLIYIDALKDVAARLSTDETGTGVNAAFNYAISIGIDVAAAHHQRKASKENKKPKAIDDVYGSYWIPAGAGSVLLIWGKAGEAVVELSQLKPVEETIEPIRVVHEHATGDLRRVDDADLLAALRAARHGLTAGEGTRILFNTDNPSKRQIEAARRRFEGYVRKGIALRPEGAEKRDEQGHPVPVRYRATRRRGEE